jgi:hypothetical protein
MTEHGLDSPDSEQRSLAGAGEHGDKFSMDFLFGDDDDMSAECPTLLGTDVCITKTWFQMKFPVTFEI